MIECVEGIVIKEKVYSETSKIIDVITPKYGKISILAKGARRIKSPFRSSTTKLTYGKFNIRYKKDKLSILTDSEIVNFYKNIKTDLTKITYASYILDLVNQVLEEENYKEIFTNLIYSLEKIENNINPLAITNVLELKCLNYLGVMPVLDSCSVCGSKSVITISPRTGGFICGDCYKNEKIVDKKVLKLIKIYSEIDIKKIDKIDVDKNIIIENFDIEKYIYGLFKDL